MSTCNPSSQEVRLFDGRGKGVEVSLYSSLREIIESRLEDAAIRDHAPAEMCCADLEKNRRDGLAWLDKLAEQIETCRKALLKDLNASKTASDS